MSVCRRTPCSRIRSSVAERSSPLAVIAGVLIFVPLLRPFLVLITVRFVSHGRDEDTPGSHDGTGCEGHRQRGRTTLFSSAIVKTIVSSFPASLISRPV